NQRRALDPADLKLVGLADIEEVEVLAAIHLRLQLFDRNLRDAAAGRLRMRGRRHNAAELLVIDERLDRRVIAADRAFRIPAQLQLAEAHLQRVVEQQAADERLPAPENQLDRLGRLDDADDAGEHAEHAPFGAARDE